jgi:hypothetical protein
MLVLTPVVAAVNSQPLSQWLSILPTGSTGSISPLEWLIRLILESSTKAGLFTLGSLRRRR